MERAIEVIGTGDVEVALKAYPNPLSVIGDCIRGMIVAQPGYKLIGGDFSGIEARVTAWLASEEWKLQVFRDYDAGLGPDPYIIFAAQVYEIDPLALAADCKDEIPAANEKRQDGKAGELAFGFQGGVKAYLRFSPDTKFSEDEIDEIKNKWREAHPKIRKMWHNLNTAMIRAVDDKMPVSKALSVNGRIWIWWEGGFMKIELPNGRLLSYPHARFTRSREIPNSKFVTTSSQYGQEGVVFKDNASGAWGDVRMYGGMATENIVQAAARDLLAEAMLRIEAAGYPIVAHIHDECIIEVPAKDAERVRVLFNKIMEEVPPWAEGLPIKVKAWISDRYKK